MKLSALRDWLGKYFLFTTAALGAYFLLAAETAILPLRRSEATAAFQIIVPVLMGQLTLIFKWMAAAQREDAEMVVNVPKWAVTSPPILMLLLVGAAIIAVVIGAAGPAALKSTVTFAVSILNATTVFLVARYFEASRD